MKMNKNHFYSASAGTGKTYTITHYYLDILKSNVTDTNITDKIIAVTFTKKAAAEMKERISQLIDEEIETDSENQQNWRQIKNALSRAQITTIDSFSSNLIKENILYTALDNSFQIMNNLQENSNTKKALNTMYKTIYAIYEEKETTTINNFKKSRKEKIKKIIQEITKIPNYKEQIKTVLQIKDIDDLFNEILRKYRYEIEQSKPLNSLSDDEEKIFQNQTNQMFKQMALLYIQIYRALTVDQNILDFFELKYQSLKLLESKPEVLQKYQNQYKYIIIDEFQDTDELQLRIFENMHTQNNYIFYVGDKKQSIYRFRGADISIFSKSMTEFTQKYGPIQSLNTNYRSFKEIVDYANYISQNNLFNFSDYKDSRLCSKDLLTNMGFIPDKEISDFNPKPDIQTQNQNIIKITANDKYRIKNIYTPEIENRNKSSAEEEVQTIAKTIKRIIKNKIYDKKQEKYRNVEFKDIAVLLRKISGYEEHIKKYFEKENINYYIVGSKMFYEKPEVKSLISLLKIIDNPNSDFDFFSSVISLFFTTKLSEINNILKEVQNSTKSIYEIFQNHAEKTPYKKQLDSIKKYSELKTILKPSKILNKIIEETNFKEKLKLLENPESAYANISKFIQQIKEYEETTVEISEIIELLNNTTEVVEEELSTSSYNDNTVKVMSIHQSKGLEFPVVITGALSKKIEVDAKIYFDKHKNEKTQKEEKIFSLEEFIKEEKDIYADFELLEISEIRRLIYVAITRPSQALINIIPNYKNKDKDPEYQYTYLQNTDYPKIDKIDFEQIPDEKIEKQQPVKTEQNINQENFKNIKNQEYRKYISPSYLKENEEFEKDTEIEEINTQQLFYEETSEDLINEGIRLHEKLEHPQNKQQLKKLIEKEPNLADFSDLEITEKIYNSQTSIPEAEFKKSITIDNKKYILTGIIDRLIINKDKIEVIDYKYSDLKHQKQIENYKFQIQLYLWLVKDLGTPTKGYILKIKNTPEIIEISPDPNFENKLIEVIRNK
jgi:ATP-dependent helicase/nuclease subunit A